MAKKHKHEEHENHERWLVSYADFITLLFAFFVVMYSISSVNEGKYRVLSDSLVAAFRSSSRTMQPVQVGELARSPHSAIPTVMAVPRPIPFNPAIMDEKIYPNPNNPERNELRNLKVDEDDWAMDAAAEQVDEIKQEVKASLGKLIDQNLVNVKQEKLWLEVELNSNFLFGSGSAQPSIDAEVILRQLARVLAQHPNPIHVEGHTDNKPIVSQLYPSNWELSSARAGAVVRLFAQDGIATERMASVGFGSQKPIASNDTESGRARNRRVVIVIIANLDNKEGQADPRNLELIRQQLSQMPSIN
ncbi:MAG TPA: flagellar motor protein MotD [Candidatus Acidoferrum sp.]|nr:flagellar motor protein MotD [Candidatus Acidoferrum sp.]